MRHFVRNAFGKWIDSQKSQKTLTIVLERMTEARQRVRSSDSHFSGLARLCIDRAEDFYQEAIYELKDGAKDSCFANCKRSLSYLKMAMLHLVSSKSEEDEICYASGSAEFAIHALIKAISRFKMGVEHTNCDVDKAIRQQLYDCVALLRDALGYLENGSDTTARNCALSGTIWIYYLGRKLQGKIGSYLVLSNEIDDKSSGAKRLMDLADSISDCYCELSQASESAMPRVLKYLEAGERTFLQAVQAYCEGDSSISNLARAGKVEVKLARELIENSVSPKCAFNDEIENNDQLDSSGSKTSTEINYSSRIDIFKGRIRRLQRILRANKNMSPHVVRYLYQVSTYYSRALRRLAAGDKHEASRYARSAHLDLDYVRQLLEDGEANYSQII